jgi:hypothetical protein
MLPLANWMSALIGFIWFQSPENPGDLSRGYLSSPKLTNAGIDEFVRDAGEPV